MKPGTQIIYVPFHADSIFHPDAEAGFVTSRRGEHVFCRYWSKYTPGELRTKANSELTPICRLVVINTRPKEDVERAMKEVTA